MAEDSALLLWQKISPSPEISDVTEALRCEIYDPLWMLGRQWQMGEFKAEDAGTAAFASVNGVSSKPDQLLGINDTKPIPYQTSAAPLNSAIEPVPLLFTLPLRIESAKKWKSMLIAAGKLAVWKKFLANPVFHFNIPTPVYNPDNEELTALSNESYAQLLATVSMGRMIDGQKLYKAMKPVNAATLVTPADPKLTELGKAWINWLENLAGLPGSGRSSSWDASRLEYSASISINTSDNDDAYLKLPEHHGRQMSHYSWQDSLKPELMNETPAAKQDTHKHTYIPVGVSFPGMPSARWWSFEDSTIDFTNLQADKTDLGLLLLAEFGVIFSNDWLIIPFNLPAGCLCNIERLDVTDVFGVESAIGSIPQNNFWEMFRTSHTGADTTKGAIYLPAISDHIIEGDKKEEVLLFRDEMSNLVWAIEKTVQDGAGDSLDGEEAARARERYLSMLSGDPELSPLTKSADTDYSYQIANTVPPNWIPFIPVRKDAGQPDIVFRRSALPRISNSKGFSRIRPATQILKNQTALQKRYDIVEEEIPMSGIVISQIMRRTRWIDGQVLTWQARQKTIGRQQQQGGLQFDQLV